MTVGHKAIIVDERHNADLLWALRGAGNGNFGIVTSLTYKVHPLTQTVYVTATWPGLDDLPAVFDAWQRSAPHVDDRLTSQLEITRDGDRSSSVFWHPDRRQRHGSCWRRSCRSATPMCRRRRGSWADTYAGFQIPTADEPANWKFVSQFISEPFPAEAIDADRLVHVQGPHAGLQLLHQCLRRRRQAQRACRRLGIRPSQRALLRRAGRRLGHPWWDPASADPLTPVCEAWIAEFAEALAPYVNGAYVNVPNAGMADWETAYWGAGVDRLRTIKAKYDPANVFSFEQSITPLPSR